MRNFKELFEQLGYTFQSTDVLEDIYLFYKYYNNNANKGVAAILLEGDPGSGKTYLSEIFSYFLRLENDTEYIYTQCVEETNSDRLIATYNVPAIVKGDADKSIAQGILTKSINLSNMGKKVVLAIDELDKAREVLDSYFLDFLQSGKIETSDNEILSLTEEGRKNLYVIFAKNNERNLLDALLRRCSVIKLPPMPPVLAYKTLLKKFENNKHDAKFLKFICKVYEAIYNEQMDSNEELLSRLPSLQELTTAITSDNELYENGISSTRRIKSLIRKLGKDSESREIITNILTKKFKYQDQDSNYTNETLDLDMNNLDNYMSTKDADSLVEQYIEKKDNGEYIFEEDEFDDPMKDIANILENMKDDQSLVFLDNENKEKIVELGVITHQNPKALEILFNKVKFKGNPNSRFGFLDFEGDNFVGLMKYKNTLILIANKEYISPRLLIRGLSTIITIIYDSMENIDFDSNFFFSEFNSQDFKLTGLNAKILSKIPKLVLDKMTMQNGCYVYQTTNLKVTYDDTLDISYFRYLQKYKAEPIYDVIEKICRFNPELAIPASFINGKKVSLFSDKSLVRKYSDFVKRKEEWIELKSKGWKVKIDDFQPMDLNFMFVKDNDDYWDEKPICEIENDIFVFRWEIEEDYKNKMIHVYPKYKLKNGYLIYTRNSDFENNEAFKHMNQFQIEIAFIARNIFGNFVPVFFSENSPEYFSSLTMSLTGRILEDQNNRNRISGISQDIIKEQDFTNYYDDISQPSKLITSEKVLKRTLK